MSLDLSKMPVTDADIKMISQFENLRRLHLNFTEYNRSSLTWIAEAKIFKNVVAYQARKSLLEQLASLKNFPKLKTVYAWNIPVDSVKLKQLQRSITGVKFETGFKGDTISLKLSPPLLQNEEQIITSAIPLKIKHFLPGVSIRYTTDGSDPDSIRSPVYKPGEMIGGTMTIKAKAYKPGWISSDIIERMFLVSAHRPDTIFLLSQTDSSYSGSSTLLNDRDKGTTNFRAGNWLAWRKNEMKVLIQYRKPVLAESVTLSSIIDIRRYIMPPVSLEIWGGEDSSNLKLLVHIKPEQPGLMKKDSLNKQEAYLKRFEYKFPPTTVKYLKVLGTPVPRLPAWITEKRDMGYIFVDEILVN